jgi:hypothetical protein
MVVPNALALQTPGPDEETGDEQYRGLQPVRPKEPGENLAAKPPTVKWRNR